MPDCTLRELARLTGFSLGTVSMALNRDKRVADATRKLVEAAAVKHAYRPEPLVRDYMSRVRHGDGGRREVAIAYVIPWESREAHYRHLPFRRFRDGAARRATEGGYRMEEFLISETGRSGRILKARGFAGVVLAPTEDGAQTKPRIDLDFCAAATIGYSLENPVISRAVHDHAGSVDRALHELVALGHRRIGLVTRETINKRICGRWLGAFLAAQHGALAPLLAPPIVLPRAENSGEAEVLGWLAQHRPDAVITSEWELLKAASSSASPRTAMPQLVSLDWHPGLPPGSIGIDQHSELVGAAAVDMVIGQISRHERGAPAVRRTLLIDGAWIDDATPCSPKKSMSVFL